MCVEIDNWQSKAQALAKTQNARIRYNIESCRDAIIETYKCVASAPNMILDHFQNLNPQTLNQGTEKYRKILSAGKAAMPLLNTEATPQDRLMDLVQRMRALEEHLFTHNFSHLNPDLWFSEKQGAYLIPFAVRSGNSRSFRRQGLRSSRIIPSSLDSYPIIVKPHKLESDAPNLSIGVGMFESFSIVTEQVGSGFRVIDVNAVDLDQTIIRQIDNSREKKIFAVIWPELSIPTKNFLGIKDYLSKGRLDEKGACLYVPGTRHEQDANGTYYNVGNVLDCNGEEVMRFEKHLPYHDSRLGTELITLGTEIYVLATHKKLIAFPICRDFCDISDVQINFKTLAVDYFLVPSLAAESSLDGHAITASESRVHTGARTYVAQHSATPLQASQRGWVVSPDSNEKPKTVNQDTEWQVYD